MANYKRKRSHRQVRCTMCTKSSWLGNHKERFKAKYGNKKKAIKDQDL